MTRLREATAASAAWVLRRLPPFRGKARLGTMIGKATRTCDREAWAPMRYGSKMLLDLRVNQEAWAFWTGEHDREAVNYLVDQLPDNGVALDVGANVGLYTIPLARKARQVFAFEPLPANHERLSENVSANDLESSVACLQLALGAANGTIVLEPTSPGGRTGNAAQTQPGSPTGVEVPIRRLDDVALELGVRQCDVIKVDIEGGELEFLRGGEQFLREHMPVIYLELNGIHMSRFGWSTADVLDLTARWGYRPVVRRGSHEYPFTGLHGASIQDVFLIRA